MGHTDADRNFWVSKIFCFLILCMMAVCVYKFGANFNWPEWTGVGVVFILISLAIILPPKVYIESVKSINFAAIAGGIKSFGRRKDDDPPAPPAGDPPPPGNP